MLHANRNKKNMGVSILISDKIDFKILLQETMKYTHYIINKGSIQEENITIINTYVPNIGAPQYIGQILTILKGLLTVNKNNGGRL